MTGVGMALHSSVSEVRVTAFDGHVEILAPKKINANGPVGRLNYLAFGVRGPWCALNIETFNMAGDLLWQSGRYRAAGVNAYRVPYRPDQVCPS